MYIQARLKPQGSSQLPHNLFTVGFSRWFVTLFSTCVCTAYLPQCRCQGSPGRPFEACRRACTRQTLPIFEVCLVYHRFRRLEETNPIPGPPETSRSRSRVSLCRSSLGCRCRSRPIDVRRKSFASLVTLLQVRPTMAGRQLRWAVSSSYRILLYYSVFLSKPGLSISQDQEHEYTVATSALHGRFFRNTRP